jgi:hypothetical protein
MHPVPMTDETHITVVRGRPDAAELAAVTAVLLALARRGREPDPAQKAAYAGWTVRSAGHRPPSWPGR